MTNEQVKADIAAHLPDNTTGAITPAILRTELGKMVDYSDTSAEIAIDAHNADAGAHGLGAATAHATSATVQPGPHSNAGASGAVVLTLGVVTSGARYRFSVLAARLLTVTAPAGVTIRVGSQVTAAGGSISSDVVGAFIEIVAEAADTLVATSTVEVW